jgi:hypothetical protein
MPNWVASLIFAGLVVTVPFTFILKVLGKLPKPLVLSHRRWPLAVNFGVISCITAYVTIFIRSAYYGRATDPAAVLMQFLIAAVAYIFGLILILRQFAGVYPEFVVTTGRSGLSIRKTVYRNIQNVEELSLHHGESHLLVTTASGLKLPLNLPSRSVSVFYERLTPQL